MAFTRITDPTNNISNLANQPVEPPATLKQKFDQIGEDLKDWNNNTFLPELESATNGDSGADNIGATALSGGVATTVQGILEELDAKAVSGSGALNTHKSSDDHDVRYYTKTTTDSLLLSNQQGNHTGAWQGVTSPTFADPGISGSLDLTIKKRDYNRKGLVKFPSLFGDLGFDVYVDFDGTTKHTFDISKAITGTSVFVSELTGLDTNDGLTIGTAVRTLEKAIQVGNANVSASIVIEFLDWFYTRNFSGISTAPTKNYTFRSSNPSNEVLLTSAERSMVWVADGTAYKATRSGVVEVCDTDYRDFKGIPKALKKVFSLSACQAELGTWYTDNVFVWVRRWSDTAPAAAPNINVLALISTAGLNITLNNKKLIQQNIKWLKPTADSPGDNCFRLIGDSGTTLINDNVAFAYGARNGLATINVGNVFNFDCTASYNGSDGFNYHAQYIASPVERAFEHNCIGYENGGRGLDGSGKNNASTAHEGMRIIRTNCIGYDCDGPIFADVNGCDSYLLNCVGFDSLIYTSSSVTPTKSAFYFDESSALKQGSAYLINCEGGGVDTFSINTDGNVPVYIHNFKGNKIETTVTFIE